MRCGEIPRAMTELFEESPADLDRDPGLVTSTQSSRHASALSRRSSARWMLIGNGIIIDDCSRDDTFAVCEELDHGGGPSRFLAPPIFAELWVAHCDGSAASNMPEEAVP